MKIEHKKEFEAAVLDNTFILDVLATVKTLTKKEKNKQIRDAEREAEKDEGSQVTGPTTAVTAVTEGTESTAVSELSQRTTSMQLTNDSIVHCEISFIKRDFDRETVGNLVGVVNDNVVEIALSIMDIPPMTPSVVCGLY